MSSSTKASSGQVQRLDGRRAAAARAAAPPARGWRWRPCAACRRLLKAGDARGRHRRRRRRGTRGTGRLRHGGQGLVDSGRRCDRQQFGRFQAQARVGRPWGAHCRRRHRTGRIAAARDRAARGTSFGTAFGAACGALRRGARRGRARPRDGAPARHRSWQVSRPAWPEASRQALRPAPALRVPPGRRRRGAGIDPVWPRRPARTRPPRAPQRPSAAGRRRRRSGGSRARHRSRRSAARRRRVRRRPASSARAPGAVRAGHLERRAHHGGGQAAVTERYSARRQSELSSSSGPRRTCTGKSKRSGPAPPRRRHCPGWQHRPAPAGRWARTPMDRRGSQQRLLDLRPGGWNKVSRWLNSLAPALRPPGLVRSISWPTARRRAGAGPRAPQALRRAPASLPTPPASAATGQCPRTPRVCRARDKPCRPPLLPSTNCTTSRRAAWFSKLTPALQSDILARGRVRRLADGDALATRGTPADAATCMR